MSRKFLFNDIRAFDPRDIRGLTLWLDYRNGVYTDTAMTTRATVGQTVKGWADRSGNGYHATEATNPPTLASDGLAFDGTNDVLRVARMTGQFGGGFSWFIVAQASDGRPASNIAIWGASTNSSVDAYFWDAIETNGTQRPQIFVDGGQFSTNMGALADGQSGVFMHSFIATPASTATGYVNGTQTGTPANISAATWANIAGAVPETPFIGAKNQGGNPSVFFTGTIRTLLIYNRPLTATELTQVHRYIGNLHGISVP